MGNVRLSVDQSGNVVQKDDYYPFGLTFNHWNSTTPENQYKFNGNEVQVEIPNFSDFNARFYDAALGRFMNIDPLAASQNMLTPYHFSYNNPIVLNDPSGLEPENTIEDLIQTAWDATPEGTNSKTIFNFTNSSQSNDSDSQQDNEIDTPEELIVEIRKVNSEIKAVEQRIIDLGKDEKWIKIKEKAEKGIPLSIEDREYLLQREATKYDLIGTYAQLRYKTTKIEELVMARVKQVEEWIQDQGATSLKRTIYKNTWGKLKSLLSIPEVDLPPGYPDHEKQLLDQLDKYPDAPEKLPYPLKY